jgi:hypothetical protein
MTPATLRGDEESADADAGEAVAGGAAAEVTDAAAKCDVAVVDDDDADVRSVSSLAIVRATNVVRPLGMPRRSGGVQRTEPCGGWS